MKFIQKIQVQPPSCKRKPPTVGPVMRPTAMAEAKVPSIWPRCSAAKLLANNAVDIGNAIANPTAITPRAINSCEMEPASAPRPAPAA